MHTSSANTYPRDPPAHPCTDDLRSSVKRKQCVRRARSFIKVLIDAQIALLALLAIMVAGGIPFGIRPYCIVSSSMEPALPRGSLVYVDTHADADTLEVGSAIAFSANQGKTVVTHRIYDKDQETGNYVTKGDANSSTDPSEVTPAQIIGEVKGHIPYLGSLLSTDKTTLALALGGAVLIDLALAGVSRRLGASLTERNRNDRSKQH